MQLRRATVEDAPAIASLWLEAAKSGFEPLLPEGFTWESWERVTLRVEAALRAASAGVLVADAGEGLRGYVGYGASRDPDSLPGVGEVQTMFVHPSAWRSGVGTALIQRAVADLRGDGFLEATVWSFLENERANAFYEAQGFERDGARRRQAQWQEADEVRYRTRL